MAEVVQKHPERFWGLGTIPLQEPKLAIKELERCVSGLKLSGVQIGTNVNGENLGERKYFEFFKACEELDAAVFIHPWNVMGENQIQKYWLPWLVGMPADLNRAICSLIFSGTLEALPRLKLALAHGGGSFAFHLGRIEQGFKARPDLVAIDNAHSPRKYLNQILVDTLVHDVHALKLLLSVFGEDCLALGSDYPFPLGEEKPGELIDSLDLAPASLEKIYYKNALKWLGESSLE
jgi:aminocarboxymuconate-semialdehyde decarboxylase